MCYTYCGWWTGTLWSWWYIAVVGAIHTLQLGAVCFPCEMNDITSPLFWYGISCRNDIHFCFLNLAINNTIIMFLSCSVIHSLFTNSPTLTHTITHHSFTPSLTHTNTHSHHHSLTPTHTHTNTHSHHHSLTPTHTHTITHSHHHTSLTRTITHSHHHLLALSPSHTHTNTANKPITRSCMSPSSLCFLILHWSSLIR